MKAIKLRGVAPIRIAAKTSAHRLTTKRTPPPILDGSKAIGINGISTQGGFVKDLISYGE